MFPKIKPVEVFIEDIPEGKAADYVLASAAAFPFMKSYKIGESAFVDHAHVFPDVERRVEIVERHERAVECADGCADDDVGRDPICLSTFQTPI